MGVVDASADVVGQLGGPDGVPAVGIGAPGAVDAKGVVQRAPNLPGWDEPFALVDAMSECLDGLPVAVDNDVNVGSWQSCAWDRRRAAPTPSASSWARAWAGRWCSTASSGVGPPAWPESSATSWCAKAPASAAVAVGGTSRRTRGGGAWSSGLAGWLGAGLRGPRRQGGPRPAVHQGRRPSGRPRQPRRPGWRHGRRPGGVGVGGRRWAVGGRWLTCGHDHRRHRAGGRVPGSRAWPQWGGAGRGGPGPGGRGAAVPQPRPVLARVQRPRPQPGRGRDRAPPWSEPSSWPSTARTSTSSSRSGWWA